MGTEIDLLKNYPKSKRNIQERGLEKTDEDRNIARKFGKDFFDGERRHGYGGFDYHPRFWQPVVPVFQKHWGLDRSSSILDVGCAKGFMMHDLAELIPGVTLKGIDISTYAVDNAISTMRPHIQVADACNLPFEDQSFDVVISINTLHNLELDSLAKALQEIERVSKEGAFITVDAYRSNAERERMMAWNLTAKTIMSVDEWIKFFKKVNYSGDYFWFTP